MNNETIAVRAYTAPKNIDSFKKKGGFTSEKTNFDRILVWDTETTTDLYQNLTFGYFKILWYGKLDYHGLFYDPAIIKGKELEILKRFSKRNKITLYTLEEFREIAPRIFELTPKDVKEFGISKQTLWNVKQKIKLSKTNVISNRIKVQLVCNFVLFTNETI